MKQGLVYSTLFHAAVFLVFLQLASFSQAPSKSYYVIDLSIGKAPAASETAPFPSASDIIKLEENKDFLLLPSKSKSKRAPSVIAQVQSLRETSETKSSASKGAGIGAGQALLGVSGGLAHFPYPSYMESIRKKIATHWEIAYWRDNLLTRKSQVVFVIERNGSIAEPEITEKSGDPHFDLTCIGSVIRAAPFPPLPQNFEQDKLRVVFDFEIAP